MRDEFPLPRIDAIFDKLRKAKYFSTLDLNTAYHQVRLEDGSKEQTAFTCDEGHYQFKVMTFGFTNAPPSFQRMMTDYLRDFLGKFVEVYLDDILIYSETWKEHVVHIHTVLAKLRQVQLTVKMGKCKWGKTEVEYLGHIIGQGKLKADEKKVSAIREWEKPKTTKELQWFLGMVNYYHEFIKDLGKIGQPLYEVKNREELEWNEEREQAFNKVKESVANLPFRRLWDPTKDIRVSTDASEEGMGLVLEQKEPEGWWPIAFFSRTWKANEKAWPVHQQEMAAFVEGLQKWRHYLMDRQIIARTDSKFVERTNTQKPTANRLIRWWEVFAEYNVKFEHVEGQRNIVADALSQSPVTEKLSKAAESIHLATASESLVYAMKTQDGERVGLTYVGDHEFEGKWKEAKEKNLLVQGNLTIGGRVCVPKVDRDMILRACHDEEGHFGIDKTYERMKEVFFWDSMKEDCTTHVETCRICQMGKTSRQKPMGRLHPLEVPKRPMEHIAIDFFFDLPTAPGAWDGCMIVVDRNSKLVKLVPVKKNMELEGIIRQYMKYVYCNYGLPASIVSDQDPRYNAKLWKGLWEAAGTTLKPGAIHHPQTDGQAERTIQTIKQILQAYVSNTGADWLEWIPLVEFWYNSAKGETTEKSPFQVTQGRNPRNPVDQNWKVDWEGTDKRAVEIIDQILRAQAWFKREFPKMEWEGQDTSTTVEERELRTRIQGAQKKYKYYYNKKRRGHNIKRGDWVLVKRKGFAPKYFSDDRKGTLNWKYSKPAKVLGVEKGTATLEANEDFLKETRVNVEDLKKLKLREGEREELEEGRGGGESVTTTTS